jgi:hypothetical protein
MTGLHRSAGETDFISVDLSLGRLAQGFLAVMTINFIVMLSLLSLMPLFLIPAVRVAAYLEILLPDTSINTLLLGSVCIFVVSVMLASIPLQIGFWGAKSLLGEHKKQALTFMILWTCYMILLLLLGLAPYLYAFAPVVCMLIVIFNINRLYRA